MAGPVVATMYATQIIQDEATGVMYMDTVTASVGECVPQESLHGGQPLRASSEGHH